MKFSVLLPTHNRLEFLKYAISSVLKQDYDDWEVVVSDNFSEQDIKGYVELINDKRIKYFRTNAFLSVTESWNYCIDQSSGEYIIMLGDDDCLMKNYFKIVLNIISDFKSPELIYSKAFLYAYPKVLSHRPNGYFRIMGNSALWNRDKPYLLSSEKRTHLVNQTFNFKVAFSYNMQFGTIHRSLVDRIRVQGKFFHSPYPDYYAMTLMMEKAKTVVACPYPIVTVGISPKSFGFYYFNKKEDEGMLFLNTSSELSEQPELAKVVLPGSHMNTCWLFSLNLVKHQISRSISINYKRYRKLQTVEFFQLISRKADRLSKIKQFVKMLNGFEKLINGSYLISMLAVDSILGKKFSAIGYKAFKRILNSHPRYSSRELENTFQNILEAHEGVDPFHYIR